MGEDVRDGQRSGERRILWSDRGFCMMGRRRGLPRWADDPVWRLDGRRQEGTRGRIQTPPWKEIEWHEGWV